MSFTFGSELLVSHQEQQYYHGHHHPLRDYATRQINVFLWVSLIFITALLLRKLSRLFRLWAQGSLIPGPPCPSFFGHSVLISQFPSLTDLLSKSHQKYGPVVKLWLGPTQLLASINDPELVKEMLLKAVDKLPLTGRAFRLAFGESSFFVSSYDKVEKKRTSLADELNVQLHEKASLISRKAVNRVVDRIHDILATGGLDCEMLSQNLAFTFLGATLFGDAFLSSPKAEIYEATFMNIVKDACFWASYNITPFWRQEFWKYQHLCAELKRLTQEIIQECRQNRKLHFQLDQNLHKENENLGQAAIGASYCPSLLWESTGNIDASEGEVGNIITLMFHGSLTTAGLIGNVLAKLVTHPEVQDKIYSEIIMAQKHAPDQSKKDIDMMPFLVATVYESARLLPAGPLLQRCSLKHDLHLKNSVTVPARALVVVPVQLVQMDHASWGIDANMFNPYRFLSKAEKPVQNLLAEITNGKQSSCALSDVKENSAFLPFGSGARACIGQELALTGVVALLASILEHYEIKLQPGSERDLKPKISNCVLQLLPSPRIIFVNRKR